jgi:hypothetical protein
MKKYATKFKAELWTTVHDVQREEEFEQWATIMLDGESAGQLCAVGSKESMERYAAQLNESKGVLV